LRVTSPLPTRHFRIFVLAVQSRAAASPRCARGHADPNHVFTESLVGDLQIHRWVSLRSTILLGYLAMRSFEMLVPIALNVVMISFADDRRKNLPGSVAQFCSNVEVGSLPVLTCTV